MNDKQLLSRAAAIQRYLEDRPESSDTLEGIHHYWIRTRGEESMELTQAALDYLSAAGFIESSTTGSRQLWRRTSRQPADSIAGDQADSSTNGR